MTAFSSQEQELFDWLKSSIPRWFFQDDASAGEIWGATVKSLQDVRAQVDDWLTAVFILTAEDIWLNQHARDRGTSRQSGETDAVLRDRLRTIDDAVTPSAIAGAVDAILAASGVAGTSALVELRRDKAYFATRVSPSGTGDSFTKSGTTVTLTDAGHTFAGTEVGLPITIVGASSGGNNGTFAILDVTGDHSITYANASGVAEAYAGAWKVESDLDGRKVAYLSRGYRMSGSGRPSTMIVILPFGTTEATRLGVAEGLRLKKAGGFKALVERRVNP